MLYNVELHNLYFHQTCGKIKRFPQFSHINITALPVKLMRLISQGRLCNIYEAHSNRLRHVSRPLLATEWRCVTSAFCNTKLFEESTHTVDVLLKIITKDESWNFACDPLNDTQTHHLTEESGLQNFSTKLMLN